MAPDQTTSENEDIYSWLDASDRSPTGLIARVILLILGATACLLLPTLGQGRFAICIVLLVYVPITWWVELKLKPPIVDIVLAIGQAVLGLIIAFTLPGLFVASLIFVLAAAVVTSPSLGMKRRFWLLPLFFAFAPIGVYHDVEGWHFLIAFAVLGFLSTSEYVSWMILRQEVVELRLSLMAYGASGVLWEFDVTSVEFNKAGGATQELLEVSDQGFLDLLNDSHNAVRFAIDASLGTVPRKVILLKAPSGRRRWVRLSAVSRTRADGTMVVHGMAFDVSELEGARELLRGKAEQDALTGLPNRDGLKRFIDESQAENTPTQGGLAIMLLDLDRFKEINDTFGHPVGDQVIRILAHRISRWAAEDVCVARLGGDEFALAVVAGRGEVESRAVSIATRIQSHAAEIISVGSLNLATSISIGVASGANSDWIELLRRADVAMYKAKRSSKVAVQVYCAEIGPDTHVNANVVTDLTSRKSNAPGESKTT